MIEPLINEVFEKLLCIGFAETSCCKDSIHDGVYIHMARNMINKNEQIEKFALDLFITREFFLENSADEIVDAVVKKFSEEVEKVQIGEEQLTKPVWEKTGSRL